MSNQNKPGKVIGRFTIGFDDETKASIADLKNKLDAASLRLSFGSVMPVGGLLAAMQDTAANDSPVMYAPWENDLKRACKFGLATADDVDTEIPADIALSNMSELKQLGQWVFEGQDKEWVSAAWDGDGSVWLFKRPSKELKCSARDGYFFWYTDDAVANKFVCYLTPYSEMNLDSIIQKLRLIDRETINDVDYLSEATSEINVMEASDIIIDEMGRDYSHNSNCLHAVVPQITQADMQLIFIKNLSETLIQRMHSMERFSEDGRRVVCGDFKAWDIVVNKANDKPHYAVVCGFGVINSDEIAQKISLIKVTPWDSRDGHCQGGDWMIFGQKSNWRTITEAELLAFRCALEACYA